MTTWAEALVQAAALGVQRLDAQLLLLHVLGLEASGRAWLIAHDDSSLTLAEQHRFLQSCSSRVAGKPLAYIVGHKEFFGLDLLVDSRVLVPRPETETLVDWALELVVSDEPRVLDLGTGSGAIALAIKRARPGAQVEAVDNSADALNVARLNARRLSLDVTFRQASWLAGSTDFYDLIVANPPYVAQDDPHLAALTHEPLAALAAGPDGLADIRSIVAQATTRLAASGCLLLEHGWDQAPTVRALLTAAGFRAVTSRRDLAGVERCSGGTWPELG